MRHFLALGSRWNMREVTEVQRSRHRATEEPDNSILCKGKSWI